MGTIAVKTANPTLPEIIAGYHGPAKNLNRDMVIRAAKLRGVVVREGRIDQADMGEIYFGIHEQVVPACPTCHGDGLIGVCPSGDPQMEREVGCPDCGGTGRAA